MKKLIVLILCLSSQLLLAQNPSRIFKEAKVTGDGVLSVTVNDGEYRINFYTSEIIETSFIPKEESFNPNSHAVVLKETVSNAKLSKHDDNIIYGTEDLYVKIQKQPFQISYYRNDDLVISEKGGYIKNDSLETIQFNLTKDEVLYGGGARALGMNRRGYRLQLYNRAHYGYETHSELMNYTMPIMVSSNQYLVHFDNAPIGFLDLDSRKDNTLTYETISGRKTYQIVVGDSWMDIMDNYTDLTGKQPMLPRWAMGNFSSRFGYHSQQETLETIAKFKKDSIPVDAIILDLYWFGKEVKGTMGNLKFFKDSFPSPNKMIKELRDNNVETILITEPFVLKTSNRWGEVVEKDVIAKDSIGNPFTYDFYFGNTGLIDIYSKKGNAWFKDVYTDLYQKGVTGIWGDLGEPEVHPSKLIHATGTADEVHNIYGHDWAKLVYESFHEISPNQRPFILMRAGYSGSQRYGMVPWSGDVNRTWGGLQSQPEIALQMGMQGIGFMHSDLGGFAGANLDDELYVRWLQYGVFQPIYRPHAQEEVASEPVFRSNWAKSLAKQAIELRYQLLPYNYNLSFQNNKKGKPLMRPLFFDEPSNENLLTYSAAYLWGDDILVAPILKSGVKEKEVYFPKPSNWFDFYSGEQYRAGSTHSVKVNENHIPTFVRGGSFVPMAKPMQSTKEYNGKDLVLHYYLDDQVSSSEYELYNDDGITNKAYENRQYELLQFTANLDKNKLQIEYNAELGKAYSVETKTITLVVHNLEKEPKNIKVDGKSVDAVWNSADKTVTAKTTWKTNNQKNILFKLKK